MLKIFNSVSNKKETFNFSKNKCINIYVCGVTVSNYCHIGHARTFYFFDIFIRYLVYLGYKYNYIRNITDIDDKIIFYSNKNNINISETSNLMINYMNNDFKKLGFIKPNLEPKVTDHIDLIIKYILILIKKKYAYISVNGDVLFNINNYRLIYNKFNLFNYKFSNNNKDFVLWKLSINSKFNSFGWYSPWGLGRPGWHIECVVISNNYFKNITIHGGGIDLCFPHHENEYIISKCLFRKKYNIKYWIHTGIVIHNDSKLSKSKNSSFFIKDLLKKYDSDVIKYYLMSNHYRRNLNFSFNNLNQYKKSFKKIYLCLKNLNLNIFLSKKDLLYLNNFDYYFNMYMNNDFNIPNVYKLFFFMVNKINKLKKKNNFLLASKIGIKLKNFANILGLLNNNKNNLNKSNIFFVKRINWLIKLRNLARKLKKWKLADWIRKKIYKNNIFIKDNINDTEWYFN